MRLCIADKHTEFSQLGGNKSLNIIMAKIKAKEEERKAFDDKDGQSGYNSQNHDDNEMSPDDAK